MKTYTLETTLFVLYAILLFTGTYITYKHGYNKGFEAGKNYVPPAMQRIDSSLVIYYGNKPMVSDQTKMPRDSVQLIIDGFMGKPKQYLLMTLKLVTKEKE